MTSKQLRILIVDDSVVFRHLVQEALQGEEGVLVIGSVRNGVKALEFIQSNRPDLVTLDVEMPDMDGYETLQRIQTLNAQHPELPPVGVIMLSSHTRRGADTTIKALQMGAFDFVGKPEAENETDAIALLKRALVPKLLHFATRRELRAGKDLPSPPPVLAGPRPVVPSKPSHIRAIFIGVSTGGPKALSDILPKLCEMTHLPILIVQHMPPSFTASLAESLSIRCTHQVKEGVDGEHIKDKTVYIAPGGMHMVVRQHPNGPIIGLHTQPPENGCRPSVDVLFRSAPSAYQGHIVAIILTGMGSDGSLSLRHLKNAGAAILAQDEASSVVWGMPGSAVETGFVDQVVPLLEIPSVVASLVQG